MALFDFRIPTEEEARRFLSSKPSMQIETYTDRLVCQRRLLPTSTPAEREANRRYIESVNARKRTSLTKP